ncbi:MAG: cation:proton antiporter [Prevotella sp.]|nr:cation:proton antiporter [Prevotella sp.]
MLHIANYFPIANPTLIFFVVLIVILLAPIVMGKLRIPHIIGMVLAGVALGRYGLNILERDDSFELFGRVGLYYIMFLASLEMDMEGLRKSIGRVTVFGLLSAMVPMVLTFWISRSVLGYSPESSMLLGCIMASNTLIAYPIVSRYGLGTKQSVAMSVGATLISLSLALILLAALVERNKGGGGVVFWMMFLLKIAAFCTAMVFFIPRLTRWFLRRYSDAVMQFIFIMAVMFLSAALSEIVGLEGIFGAFLAGLILNRYIPRLSALMGRIEFIGNALFIPYFLIGVGMLINVGVLFHGWHIVWVVIVTVFCGTAGKAVAAYLSGFLYQMPMRDRHMMFGLTSAHAAGAIAMVTVGIGMKTASGDMLVDDDMINGVVVMILFTCIISTIITEKAAGQITLHDAEISDEDSGDDDEKIIIPMKYPEYAERLVSLAILTRNEKLERAIVGLNVVYDDQQMRVNQAAGARLLDDMSRVAAAANVRMQTQVRVAANIANGIKHAFKEFRASEIIIGLHTHKEVSTKFWGEFHQSLFNGLNRQIMMARLMQPLATIRRIQVAVPSRAQFEPGFYRWLERLDRLAANLDCRILFHGRNDTLQLIAQYTRNRHPDVRADFQEMNHWNELPRLASTIAHDHLFVVVTARKGTVSYKAALDRLPDELTQFFSGTNLMIVFPDQYGDLMDNMTFAQPQHTEDGSAYEAIRKLIFRK